MKANDEVKAATTQAIAGASTDDEKLKRIYDFVKAQIKNISYADNVTDEEKKKAGSDRSAGDILKSRIGSASDIDVLFGAMVRSAGYDARLALSGDRSDLFFNPRIPNLSLMLNSTSIAVKVGNEWRFFSPASYFATYGMLSWNEEGQMALITDSKELIWQKIPLASAEKSMEKRSGKFKILEDGTLEGEARIEFTGHAGSRHKMSNRGDSPAVQEKNLKDLIRSNILGTAEVESISIENARDPEKPIVYTFKVRVPGYASRTGKRIFFQPNVFERSSKPRFVASSRQSEVYFNYPFSEQDDITIELPAGFTLENGDTPAAYGDQQGIGKHETTIGVTADGKTVSYKRSFSFGNGGFIRFPVDSYGPIKTMFENFNKADVHQLTLRQEAK
ncbi:MAG: transglutaminase-like domain-containing protein [Pyrinomonadaceae bacterium]